MLHLQFSRTSIPRYLEGMPGATSDSIANKSGALDAVRNDVAAISPKNGMVVISAFTFNNKDHSWGADHEAELTIAKLARAIIQSWSPVGCVARCVRESSPQGQVMTHEVEGCCEYCRWRTTAIRDEASCCLVVTPAKYSFFGTYVGTLIQIPSGMVIRWQSVLRK